VRGIVRWGDDCVGGISSGGCGGGGRLRHSRAHSLQAAQLSLQFSLLALQLSYLQAIFFYRFLLVKNVLLPGLGLLEAGLRIRIHFIRIRIQHFRLNTNTDPDPIQDPGLNDQKLEKNYR
jgi:hypothetical protein